MYKIITFVAMKITPIELLSPAKDVDVGIAAINHGADAVYIGGPAFGAREKAGNTINDIERLCRHAALFDAKVYVTLNTLLFDHELEQARKIAYSCWDAGVDALIVQDMALLQLDLPPIPLHASTQCDNLTVSKVKALEAAGFSQVVLGRELSIEEIREIRRQTTVPLEFFVHGALCVSHSGQCYLSQYIGNRSANRGACAQPCRLPWDLVAPPAPPRGGEVPREAVLVKGKHLFCLKDLNNSANLEELLDAGISSLKIEGRLKDADYVKNVTAFYRQQLDALFERRAASLKERKESQQSTDTPLWIQASEGRPHIGFEINPEKSFNRGFTDYFLHGRQPNIGSPDTPKSMGEYVGKVTWCNSVQMEILTDKALHNGDGLCFLNQNDELIGIRADVVRPGRDATHSVSTVSCNRPHGAFRGAKIYRNYDIEWQRQVEASNGNRKIDIDLVLSETTEGFDLTGKVKGEGLKVKGYLSIFNFQLSTPKIPATNPEKAVENIRKKALQWGDTVFNPVRLELRFSEPWLIPASVLGELKRGLVERMTESLIAQHQDRRPRRDTSAVASATPAFIVPYPETKLSYMGNVANHLAEEFYRRHGVTEIEEALEKSFSKAPGLTLMTCHHCIRYANGMCMKNHPSYTGPLYISHGEQLFRLEFDCKQCLMKVISV